MWVLPLVITLAAPTIGTAASGEDVTIAVIVSRRWEAVDAIDEEQLRNIYLGRLTTFRGERARPIHRGPRSQIRQVFTGVVVGMTAAESEEHWVLQELRGGPGAPRPIESFAAAVGYVSKVKGAIAYVDASKLDDDALQVVKVVRTVQVSPETGFVSEGPDSDSSAGANGR